MANLTSKQLLIKIIKTVNELDMINAISRDDCTCAPFSLHYHVGNSDTQYEPGWYASVAWRERGGVDYVPASDGKDIESDIYPDIRQALVWLDTMLSKILNDHGGA